MSLTNPWYDMVSARAAGLLTEASFSPFKHTVMNGSAREMLVAQFLRPFLPSYVGIGSGEVINHLGQRSRQVDVILYLKDNISPALLSDGYTGVFPWECVIATIEVKSTLNAEEAVASLLNALSVNLCTAGFSGAREVRSNDRTLPETSRPIAPPASFLFAFNSDKKASKTPGDGPEWERLNYCAEKAQSEADAAHKTLTSGKSITKKMTAKLERVMHMYNPSYKLEDGTDASCGFSNKLRGICVGSKEWSYLPTAIKEIGKPGQYTQPFWSVHSVSNMPYSHHLGQKPAGHEGEYMVRFLIELLKISEFMRTARSIYRMDRYLAIS